MYVLTAVFSEIWSQDLSSSCIMPKTKPLILGKPIRSMIFSGKLNKLIEFDLRKKCLQWDRLLLPGTQNWIFGALEALKSNNPNFNPKPEF